MQKKTEHESVDTVERERERERERDYTLEKQSMVLFNSLTHTHNII